MDEMFQLSVELYDTKDKKVVWSDRWQEKWDNLPTIQGSLSDGILKILDTKKQIGKKVENTNTEAYEYYLKAKYKFLVGGTIEELEIARGLTQKAIELDDNLLLAKNLLGWYCLKVGEHKKGFDIYNKALNQSKTLKNKQLTADSLQGVGFFYQLTGEFDKRKDYYTRSLKLCEELDDKKGIANCLSWIGEHDKALDIYKEINDKRGMEKQLENIGANYVYSGDYDKALDYFTQSNIIKEEMGYKRGTGRGQEWIGAVYFLKGDLDTSLDYNTRALSIRKELGNNRGIAYSFYNMGLIYFYKGAYNKAKEYFEKSLVKQNEIELKEGNLLFNTTIILFRTYKELGIKYDENEIHLLIKKDPYISWFNNNHLYLLLENTSYLKTAYNQVQELTDNLEPDVAAKFLSYPIPKAIVEEWNKICPAD